MKTFAWKMALAASLCIGACFAQGTATVVNYSGFTGTFPVAPGSVASVYGDFGNVTTTTTPTVPSAANPMGVELAGVRVRINNVDAPLYFVSRNQINFVVPAETPNGRHTVQVVSGGNVVASGSVLVFEVGPGLASLVPSDPTRPGVILNQDNSVNGSGTTQGYASKPAARNEIVQIYATGCGALNPSLPNGVPASGTTASVPVAPVRVIFGAVEVTPSFVGAHSLFPGVCQINAVVPTHASVINGPVPVFFTVNGVQSNFVTVFVQ